MKLSVFLEQLSKQQQLRVVYEELLAYLDKFVGDDVDEPEIRLPCPSARSGFVSQGTFLTIIEDVEGRIQLLSNAIEQAENIEVPYE